MSVSGVGIGAVLPSMDAQITEGIERVNRGTTTSLYCSMRFIGVALGPKVVSLDKPGVLGLIRLDGCSWSGWRAAVLI